jgi:FGGY-family pentulose kinase
MPDGVIAVDVGSREVRAGLFDLGGALLASARRPITLGRHSSTMATYAMEEIWDAVCEVVGDCGREARDLGLAVTGLAFDATSSLYVGEPVGEGQGDVFGWMDHRAADEAAEIDATRHPYLRVFGGAISPEIHLPKMLWHARHRTPSGRPADWRDVCDELARRATGEDVRSKSALVCKWPYVPGEAEPWCRDLVGAIDLDVAGQPGFLEAPVRELGAVHGRVTVSAADRLGIAPGVVVGVGAIDAEAGVLGNIGPDFTSVIGRTLLMTGGTSTNFMAFAERPTFIAGVWGPFVDAVVPGYSMHEGGQSLSGGALDAVFAQHPASPGAPSGDNHARAAAEVLDLLAHDPRFGADKHLVPDWLGNRAPLNDARVRAIMTGIGPELDHASFLETYYATARGLALQMRQVIGHLDANGYAIDTVHLAGGHRHNPLLVRLYADCFSGSFRLSGAAEPVLSGTAMIAAVAAGHYPSLIAAAGRMSRPTTPVARDGAGAARLERDYALYLRLYEVRNEIAKASRSAP